MVKWGKERENMMTRCHNSAFFRPFGRVGWLTVFVYQTGEKEEFYFRECLEKRGFMPFLKEKERLQSQSKQNAQSPEKNTVTLKCAVKPDIMKESITLAATGQQSVSEGDRKYIFEASSRQIDKND